MARWGYFWIRWGSLGAHWGSRWARTPPKLPYIGNPDIEIPYVVVPYIEIPYLEIPSAENGNLLKRGAPTRPRPGPLRIT